MLWQGGNLPGEHFQQDRPPFGKSGVLNGERSTRGNSVHNNPAPSQRAHRHVSTVIKKKNKAR